MDILLALLNAIQDALESMLPTLEKIEHLLFRLALVVLNLLALVLLFGSLVYAKIFG